MAGPEDLTPLANRIALLTLAAALGFMVGLVTMSAALAGSGLVLAHVVASLPLLAAAGAVVRIRRLRSELRRKRESQGAPARGFGPDVATRRR